MPPETPSVQLLLQGSPGSRPSKYAAEMLSQVQKSLDKTMSVIMAHKEQHSRLKTSSLVPHSDIFRGTG